MDAETFLAQYDPTMRDLALQARKLTLSALPGVMEVVSLGYSQIQYGVGEKLTDAYAYIAVYKDHVNIGFMRGTLLPDPVGLLEGTGKTLRHVKIRSAADLEKHAAAIRDLLQAAVAEKAEK